jgi:NAD(P)-dependent dehydrogenase (short-subunit alcohol dehydrogenase family)
MALVLEPLAALLPSLADRGGSVIVISSEFVRTTPAEWPQYVSAKCAIEGLVRVAAAQVPAVRFWIVRPPKLLTDMTNTPMARLHTIPPEKVARVVLDRIHGPMSDGNLQVVEEF